VGALEVIHCETGEKRYQRGGGWSRPRDRVSRQTWTEGQLGPVSGDQVSSFLAAEFIPGAEGFNQLTKLVPPTPTQAVRGAHWQSWKVDSPLGRALTRGREPTTLDAMEFLNPADSRPAVQDRGPHGRLFSTSMRVARPVRDLSASFNFYVDVLGLDHLAGLRDTTGRRCVCRPTRGRLAH
jgi:hypothetical protein